MRRWASSKAWRPTASSLYSTTTWYTPASVVAVVRAKVTGQPAWACSASAAVCSTWASETSPLPPSGCSMPMAGNRARSRASKPAIRAMARSDSAQATTASMAMWRLQRLGPRRARVRDTSMEVSFCGPSGLAGPGQFEGDGINNGWASGGQGAHGRQFRLERLDAGADEVGGNVQRPRRANGGQQGIGVGLDGVAPERELGERAQHMLGAARGQHHAAV